VAETTVASNADALTQAAFDHCVFPLIERREVHEGGPHIYAKGEGIVLTDIRGKTYLDMMSSHTRANVMGYGNDEIARAVYEQLKRLHYVGTIANLGEPAIRLAQKVAALTPGDLNRVLFVSGGSEAVESAIKIAKQYHVNRGAKPRAYKVISRWNAYHGATMGALAVTDWLGTRTIAEPGVPGSSFIPAPTSYRNPFGLDYEAYGAFCAEYLEQQILHEGPELVSAFIAEPIMQANGVQIPPPAYLPRVRAICDKYEVLLILDEIITGFGRVGQWFAAHHFGIVPDIITMAKAITAGYMPLGAVAARTDVIEAMPIFRHVHTFMGHLAGTAAANCNIAIYERENLIQKGRDNGAYFLDALQQAVGKHPIVGQVRGLGCWLAVELTADRKTKAPFADDTVKAVVQRMRKHGVLGSPIGDAFELAPSLITTRAQYDAATEVIARSIDEVARARRLV